MSKFSIAARVVELRQAGPTLSSKKLASDEVEQTLLKHFLKKLHLHKSAHTTSVPTATVEAQSVEEKIRNEAPYKTSPYDLALNNPHVIAATLFSRKRR